MKTRQQGFGIAMPAPTRSLRLLLQPCSQSEMVVDLAVESNHELVMAGEHRLVAGIRQIENGQAPMPQGKAAGVIQPHALVVWASVGYRFRHALDNLIKWQ